MNKKKMLKHLSIITACMALNVALFQNCSAPEVSFEALKPNSLTETPLGGGSGGDPSNPGNPTGPTQKLISEDLGIQRVESKQLDVVWVIDNSGSMSQEAAHVRANYEQIINKMKDNALIKSALISRKGTNSTNVSIPVGLDPSLHKQINYGIGSTNALCAYQTSLLSVDEINSMPASYSDNCMNQTKLSLADFYRAASTKVVIFVTDDNETRTNSNNMMSVFQSKFGAQKPIVYSFIGLGKNESPCQARTGSKYQAASSDTNGEVFNICDTDWSSHYDKLVNHVNTSIKNTFSLAHSDIYEVKEVKVDDLVLTAGEYTLNNGLLTIDPNLITASSARVKVQYIIETK